MANSIRKVEVSRGFWGDLEGLRHESFYGDLRRAVGRYLEDMQAGRPIPEAGFKNSKLRGVKHLRLPRGLRLFYAYTGEGCVRLCRIADHKSYGFKGKHRSREAEAADRLRREIEAPAAPSPGWATLPWRRPSELLDHPELAEVSTEGLQRLLDEVEGEVDGLPRLCRDVGVRGAEELPEEKVDAWLEDLVRAADALAQELERRLSRAAPAVDAASLRNWSDGPFSASPT